VNWKIADQFSGIRNESGTHKASYLKEMEGCLSRDTGDRSVNCAHGVEVRNIFS